MKINKQLFEDVLSGKLKGMFVLRNGNKIDSDKLYRNKADSKYVYPYFVNLYSYTTEGYFNDVCKDGLAIDIVDFIPDVNMKQNELTIEIPSNKIVDWEESKKQNKIVLKDKQLTYEDICKKLFKDDHYSIAWEGYPIECCSAIYNASNATTEHQLECILAKNKLANVAKYLNEGWKPGRTDLGHFDAWVLFAIPNKDFIGYVKIENCSQNSNALFKSKELAQRAIKILGEETVKLALEPLGI